MSSFFNTNKLSSPESVDIIETIVSVSYTHLTLPTKA